MTGLRLLFVLLVLVAGLRLAAQSLTPLRESGPRAHCVNLVFVAEGYTAAEVAQFQADAAARLQLILGNEAWSPFAGVINAGALFVPSGEAGADDPATGTVRDTWFNSTFGYFGNDRLIGIDATGRDRLLTLLTAWAPDYDIVILLVNSPKYGGAGGFPAITSLHAAAGEILLHELGHSFAALTDEYVDPAAAAYYPPAEYPNATQQSAPALIPWRAFIQPATPLPTATAPNEDTAGLFPGSHYRATGFYRPTANSKMRTLGRPFGPVNLRAFAAAIHRLDLNLATAAPVITQPPVGVAVQDGQSCTLTVTATGTGPLTYQWRFHDTYLVNATGPTLTLNNLTPAQFGVYSVEVTNAAGMVTSPGVSVAPFSAPRQVVAQPAVSTVTAGGSVTFTATAEGTTPFIYQWHRNGVQVAGATGATLLIHPARLTDQGTYALTVTNAAGSATSNPVVLIVTTP